MVKDGYRFALPPLILGVILMALQWWWGAVFLALGIFILYFFRDPERRPPQDAAAVVSPADGRVMEIVDEPWNGRAGKRVSIFLSVFDVHVNRAPVAGKIHRMQYTSGKFLAAWKGKASAENEQNLIVIDTPGGEVAVKQIAGWVARRILVWKAAGDPVERGERFGMIRFGSRTDLWIPAEAEILARVGQHVAGGATQIARWQPTKSQQ